MRRIVFLILLLIPAGISAGDFGRGYRRKAVRIGPFAGIAAPNVAWEDNMIEMDPRVRLGYSIGCLAEFRMNNNVYFQPGLALSGKGYRLVTDQVSLLKKNHSINYLDIPLNFKMSRTHDMTDMSLFGGPYFAFGLWGTTKTTTTGDSPKTQPVVFGTDPMFDNYRRMDAGFNIGISVEAMNVQYILQYGVGFMNISPEENNTMRNRFLSFTIAYMIN